MHKPILLALFAALAAALGTASPAAAQTITQTAQRGCLQTPSDTIRISRAISTGDDLIVLVSGQGLRRGRAVHNPKVVRGGRSTTLTQQKR